MAITRYRHALAPWRAMDQMAREWDRLFGESALSEERTSNWLPAVNVEETKNEVILTAELPGLSGENVQIELENNVLTIRGHKERARERDEKGAQYHVWERQFGSFHRSFSLPRTVAARRDLGVFRGRCAPRAHAEGARVEGADHRDPAACLGDRLSEGSGAQGDRRTPGPSSLCAGEERTVRVLGVGSTWRAPRRLGALRAAERRRPVYTSSAPIRDRGASPRCGREGAAEARGHRVVVGLLRLSPVSWPGVMRASSPAAPGREGSVEDAVFNRRATNGPRGAASIPAVGGLGQARSGEGRLASDRPEVRARRLHRTTGRGAARSA